MNSIKVKIRVTQWLIVTGGVLFLVSLSHAQMASSCSDGGCVSQATAMQPFPHIVLYGGANSSGWPFVGSTEKVGMCLNNNAKACSVNTDCGSYSTACQNPAQRPGPTDFLNTSALDLYAKYMQVIIPATPLSDGRTDIILALRARNPNLKIFAYVMGHTTWCPRDNNNNIAYPTGYFYRDYYLAVTGGDPSCLNQSNRFLWNQAGALFIGDTNVNLAYREQQVDGSYRYLVAEAIAEAMYKYAKASKGYDGMFIDVFCRGVSWAQTPNNMIDFARAGYANQTTFDQGWAAAHQRLAERLRELAVADGNPDYPIAANCGQSPSELLPVVNGWMRENFPFQNGGTFFSNLLTYPWGYLHQDYLFRSPQYNYIFTAADPSSAPYTAFNQQKMRFGLGSVTLGNGYHAFEDGAASPIIADYETWWFDEYGVDTTVPQSSPEFGKAKNNLAYTGWLGQPLGNFYQMVYRNTNTNPDLLTTNQGFETAGISASNLPGWTFINFSPSVANVTRDTVTAAVGNASAKIHIDQGNGQYTYAVNIHPNQKFFVGAYQQYSVTFWAKASTNRTVDISLWDGGMIKAFLTLPITAEWKQYQALLKPTSSFNAALDFDLGRNTGDVWIDDVHVQSGASSVYRRDFDHGIVLVNPSDSTQVVQLERPYKKISGVINLSVNDGLVTTSITLAPNYWQGVGDAIFLLNYDSTPPVINSVAISSISTTGAVISWTTDELSTSQVEYGNSSSYGSKTNLDQASAATHSVVLSGLASNTMYHFRVRSKDQGNNETMSSDATFTTLRANTSPVLSAIDNKSIKVQGNLNFEISATDLDGDVLTYSAVGLPLGATFDAVTHRFDWTPKAGQGGAYEVTFKVSDLYRASDEKKVTIIVYDISVSLLPPIPVTEPPIPAVKEFTLKLSRKLSLPTVRYTTANYTTVNYPGWVTSRQNFLHKPFSELIDIRSNDFCSEKISSFSCKFRNALDQ